jgi:hypothetical protein
MIIALTSMVIREAQIGHLSKRMSEDFVTRLVCYVKKNFPVKFTALGEESVRALARQFQVHTKQGQRRLTLVRDMLK